MPVTHVPITIPDATTYTVKAQDSGLTHWIPDLTANITITLPTPKAGLKFKFAYAGAAADAQNWLIVAAGSYFKGGGVYVDTDAGDLADEVFPVFSNGNSNDNLTVLTPQAGTWVEVECGDDATWYVNAFVASATAASLAFAD